MMKCLAGHDVGGSNIKASVCSFVNLCGEGAKERRREISEWERRTGEGEGAQERVLLWDRLVTLACWSGPGNESDSRTRAEVSRKVEIRRKWGETAECILKSCTNTLTLDPDVHRDMEVGTRGAGSSVSETSPDRLRVSAVCREEKTSCAADRLEKNGQFNSHSLQTRHGIHSASKWTPTWTAIHTLTFGPGGNLDSL